MFLASPKTLQSGGRQNALTKPGKPYLPPKSFLCGLHFFRQRQETAKRNSSLEQGGVWFLFPILTGSGALPSGTIRTARGVTTRGLFSLKGSLESLESSIGLPQVRCHKWGFKGCLAAWPPLLEIGLFHPFQAFLPFSPFSGGCKEHPGNLEDARKKPFPRQPLSQ